MTEPKHSVQHIATGTMQLHRKMMRRLALFCDPTIYTACLAQAKDPVMLGRPMDR